MLLRSTEVSPYLRPKIRGSLIIEFDIVLFTPELFIVKWRDEFAKAWISFSRMTSRSLLKREIEKIASALGFGW